MAQFQVNIEDESPPLTWREVVGEHEIISVLTTRPVAGEQAAAAFQRKEVELRAILSKMSVLDAQELHRRLTLALADDPIAGQFARLTIERRVRLLAFLADAHRRHALQGTR
jgi:hypothetical protein